MSSETSHRLEALEVKAAFTEDPHQQALDSILAALLKVEEVLASNPDRVDTPVFLNTGSWQAGLLKVTLVDWRRSHPNGEETPSKWGQIDRLMRNLKEPRVRWTHVQLQPQAGAGKSPAPLALKTA